MGQRPQLEQAAFRAKRPDAVRRHAREHRQQEVVREQEFDRVDRVGHRHAVEVRHVFALGPQLGGDLVVEDAVPHHHRLGGILRQLDVGQLLGDLDFLGVDHAGHAFAQQAQVLDLRGDVLAHGHVGVDRQADAAGVHAVHHVVEHRRGLLQLRMRAHDVVAFHEGFHRHLPVGRQDGGVPPFRLQLAHTVRLDPVGHRADRVAVGRGVVVEIDEGATAPQLDAARPQRQVGLVQLGLAEHVLAVDEGVLAFGVPAPAVEGADEPWRLAVAVPAFLDERHAAVAAGVMEGFHAVLAADHDHRLAEDGVLHPVADIGNLLEPASHLPDVRPQVLAFEAIEFLVEIAPRRDALGVFHRERNGPIRSH